jgi:ABC-2 type transport system permease protein
MPGWLQGLSAANPMSYEVDALRGLLIGTPSSLLLDLGVLMLAVLAGVAASASLLPRLAR